MVMVGQHRRLSEPLRWPRGGRLAVILVGIAGALAVAAVIVIASLNMPKHRSGCIELTFASTLGGAAMHACGTHARSLCATPGQNPGLAAHGVLEQACQRAKLPYGNAKAR